MPEWNSTPVTATGTVVQVPIVHNDSTYMWEIRQITVSYSKNGDQPNAGVLKNGLPAVGAAPLQPGPGVNFPNTALTQTFAGLPYIWSEVRDQINVVVTQATVGAVITVYVQYFRYRSDDPDVQQWKTGG